MTKIKKKNTAPDPLSGGRCPQCEQQGYTPGSRFHWCGDARKQCGLCGKDIDKSCPGRKQPGRERTPIKFTPGLDCPTCGRAWNSVTSNKMTPQGIRHCVFCPKCKKTDAWKYREKNGIDVIWCPNCKEDVTAIPKPKKEKSELVEIVSSKEWKKFQRFKDSLAELEELSGEILSNWKYHLRYLQEEYSMFNGDVEDLDDPIRKFPRLLKFILTGHLPPMTVEDDDLDYYDEDLINTPTREPMPRGKQIVEVHITDISTGDL